ncbi:MAG: molecular chaperone TorD [Rhodospirillales bacterium]|nr:molecular chaperone TorD [Rhodospirillales bacterium]
MRKSAVFPREAPAEEDLARARFHALLSRVLARPLDAAMLESVRALEGNASEFGRAIELFAGSARQATIETATEEFSALFFGMGAGGELLPYGSYYRTGMVYDKPLADLRGDLARLGIGARAETTEPEDHIAFMCEVMHGLIVGTFGAAQALDVQRDFFLAHIEPWAARFFADLEKAKTARLYAPLGTIGRLFMAIETEGFAADA